MYIICNNVQTISKYKEIAFNRSSRKILRTCSTQGREKKCKNTNKLKINNFLLFLNVIFKDFNDNDSKNFIIIKFF